MNNKRMKSLVCAAFIVLCAKGSNHPTFEDMEGCINKCFIQNNCIQANDCSMEYNGEEFQGQASEIEECKQLTKEYDQGNWEESFKHYKVCFEKQNQLAKNEDLKQIMTCVSQCPKKLTASYSSQQCIHNGNCIQNLNACTENCKYTAQCVDNLCYGDLQEYENMKLDDYDCELLSLMIYFDEYPYIQLTEELIFSYRHCLQHFIDVATSEQTKPYHTCQSQCIDQFDTFQNQPVQQDPQVDHTEYHIAPKLQDLKVCGVKCDNDNKCGKSTKCRAYLDGAEMRQNYQKVDKCTQSLLHQSLSSDWKSAFSLYQQCIIGVLPHVEDSHAKNALQCHSKCVDSHIKYYDQNTCVKHKNCYANYDSCTNYCQAKTNCDAYQCFNTKQSKRFNFESLLIQNDDCRKIANAEKSRTNPFEKISVKSLNDHRKCYKYLRKNHSSKNTDEMIDCWGKCYGITQKNVDIAIVEESSAIISQFSIMILGLLLSILF